jgi:hypothetical protein
MTGFRWLVATGMAAAVALAGAGGADAGLSKKVQKKFKGKILITDKTLDLDADDHDDKQTIKYCEKSVLKEVKSFENADGVAAWSFHYTAFLKRKPNARMVSFDFYTDDGEKRYVANKRMAGVDPGVTTLQGQFKLTEDDGLNKNRSYILKLTAEVKGKEVVLATTRVKTK